MTDATTNITNARADTPPSAPPASEQPDDSDPASTSTSVPASSSAATQAPESTAKHAKQKRKAARRARPRRRGGAGESDGELDGDGAESDVSLTSASASEQSESEDDDEDEDDHEPAPAGVTKSEAAPSSSSAIPPSTAAASAAVFEDVSSVTPAAWSGEKGDVEEVSFEDFNRGVTGAARGTAKERGRGRSRGAAVGGEARPKREYTEEETAKYEAMKAKRKEKIKAKKAELKEQKKKEKENAENAPNDKGASSSASKPAVSKSVPAEDVKAKPAKGKGKKSNNQATTSSDNAVTELANSTAVLSLDADAGPSHSQEPDVAADQPDGEANANVNPGPDETSPDAPASSLPSRVPRINNREAYAEKVATDPKFTPRVGNFWTHDQRLYEGGAVGEGYSGLRQMSEFWRGRGAPRGAFRGGPGFRGRGRGGLFPGNRGRGGFTGGFGHSGEVPDERTLPRGRGSRLAMDTEAELEVVRASARERLRREQELAESVAPVEEGAEEPQADQPPVAPRVLPPTEKKWGHEGYEAISAVDQMRANRGFMRGRGRGRGMFTPPGGHFPPVRPIATGPSQPADSGRDVTSRPIPTAPSGPSKASQSTETNATREGLSTQPDADLLLGDTPEGVMVKLPGSAGSVVPPSAPSVDVKAAETSTDQELAQPSQAQTAAPSRPVSTAPDFVPSLPPPNGPGPAPPAHPQAQMYTGDSHPSSQPFPTVAGSENGSVGSGHFVPQPTGQFIPPGVGVGPSGEFYAMSNGSGEFRPGMPSQHPAYLPRSFSNQQHPQHQAFFPPQSYSPDPFGSQRGSFSGQQPMSSPQGVYYPGSANGYVDRSGSPAPFNPYAQVQASQVGGYFIPPRSSTKVSIRAPKPGERGETDSPRSDNSRRSRSSMNGAFPTIAGQSPLGSGAGAPVQGGVVHGNGDGTVNGDVNGNVAGGTYYAQHYNPYAGAAPSQYGMDMAVGPNGRPQDGGMFYPGVPNSGWTPQAQAQMQMQGYSDGGYYDASGYGYQ